MTFEELKVHLKALTSAEKVEVINMLAVDLAHIWPGIVEMPNNAGGFACIKGSPYSVFPIWVLEGYRRAGWSEARVLEKYPGLTAVDLVNAWAYADAHLDQMNETLQENSILDWQLADLQQK